MKKEAIAVLLIAVIGSIAIFFMGGFGDSSKTAATVNGEKITSKEFEDFKNKIIAQQGIDFSTFDLETKKQFESSMLDGLISQKVLDQAIEKTDIKIETSEVDAKFAELKAQIGDEEKFKSLMSTENLTEQKLKDQIEDSLKQEKYFAQNIDFTKIVVTDEEIKTAFEEFSKGQEIGTLEENKEKLKEYLNQQKKQDLIVTFVESLKKSATIEINLPSGE